MTQSTRTPWHLWAVGAVTLVWNGFGAMDYTLTQMRDRDYIASMVEALGINAESALTYFDAFPLWMDAAWALGVWGAVLGSLLLLLRSRFAGHAIGVSFAGLVVSASYQFIYPVPGVEGAAIPIVFTVVIFAVTGLLLWYSRAMTRRGVLR